MSKLTKFSELKKIPCESSWFEPYKVAEGVTAIYEPHHFQEVISYLIEGNDKALLLDSGMGLGKMKAMVEFLTDKPVTLVTSHSHFDHVGDNWRFPETHLLNLPDYVARLGSGDVFQADAENRVPEALWYDGEPWFDLKTWHTKPCKVVPIEEGHVFDLGGRKLRVIATPGHTKDCIMLADDENKLLFTGDTIYPAPMYAYIEGPEMVPVYLSTVIRLAADFSDYTLFCSHNNPVWDGSALREIEDAFGKVLSGEAVGESDPKTEGDNFFYNFGDFGIVLTRQAADLYGAKYRKHFRVVGAIIEHDGKILCMQRPKGKYPSTDLKWEFPGGKIEAGETGPQALMRELREEMDFDVTVRDEDYFATVHHVYPEFELTMDTYLCHAANPAFTRKEHVDHCWLAPQDMPSLDWAAADRPIVEKIIERAQGDSPRVS